MFDSSVPSVALIGLASWDRILVVNSYPGAGSWAYVDNELSLQGGTTTNTAVTLARLGADVHLRAVVGDDAAGDLMLQSLRDAGISTEHITIRNGEPTDAATVIVTREPAERTIYWTVGAALRKGDPIDIDTWFSQDVLVLDVSDAPLRRFLTDLPAHTRPAVQMLGTLTYLAGSGETDDLDVALRFDVLVGNERQYCELTGASTGDDALGLMQSRMSGNNIRTAVMSKGDRGCAIATLDDLIHIPPFDIDAVDTTGAGDAFAAGIAWGMAKRWDWQRTGTFANAVGALSTRQIGAQSSLPNLSEVEHLMAQRTLES